MNNKLILHVALDGCNGWSGLLPTPNQEGTDGPLKTITNARDKIRAIRASGKLTGPVEVQVHHGLHELSETFFLSEEDFGDKETPVKYLSAGDGEVILTGSKRLTGFEPVGNGVYKLNLAEQGLKGLHFKQLFCNGVRQIMSRYPNYEPENPYSGGWLYVEGDAATDVLGIYDEKNGFKDRFICKDPRLKTWKKITEAEVFVYPRYNWMNEIMKIKSYDPETGEIVVNTSTITLFEIYPGDRFYFRNVAEELDAPGEWYLDRENDTLYFHPPVDLADAIVTVPVSDNIITIDGSPQKYKSYNEMVKTQGQELYNSQDPESITKGYISFEGFTIEGCDGVGVFIRNARGCSIDGCTVRNTGIYGIRLLGGAECRISDSDIYETGSDGIFVRGGWLDEHDARYNQAQHEVRNNYIHHVGVFDKAVAGIRIDGSGNIAANNLIHDTPRWGIISGGCNNILEYNHIRHVNLETSDTAAIDFCNRNYRMRGNKVRYNLIHDVLGDHLVAGKWLKPTLSYGIYLDDFTSFTEIVGNITYRTPKGGVLIHNGQNNLVENNMLLGTTGETVMVRRCFDHQELQIMGTYGQAVRRNTFRKNIMASDIPSANAYFFDNIYTAEGKLDMDTNVFEDNTVWFNGNPAQVQTVFLGKKISWEEWIGLGYETGTIIADPKIKNSAEFDFTLAEDSPALQKGFKPIPVEKIGPYKTALRKVWPIVEAEGIREHPSDLEDPETRKNK